MIITKQQPLSQFLQQCAYLPVDITEQVAKLSKPETLGGYTVPSSLDELSIGKLFELQSTPPAETLFAAPKIILGIEKAELLKCSAIEVLGFNVWVGDQMAAAAQMFNAIPHTITAEEKRAGAEKLNFGLFGIIDAYARRMGIANHDEVLQNVSWLRVCVVMKNDAQTALYERRLREIITKSK